MLAATATLLGFSAAALTAAAQAQSEVLAGTATTTSGSWSCFGAGVGEQRHASAAFQATGTATGTYPGPFAEAGAVSLSGDYGPLGWGRIQIGFTVTSNTATIKGTITRNVLYGFIYCGGSFGFNTSSAAYTATIQVPGQAALAIGGSAQLVGDLSTQANSQGLVTATLTLP